MAIAEQTMNVDLANKAKDLEAAISLYTKVLEKYQADSQIYSNKINEETAKQNLNLQKYINEITLMYKLLDSIKQEYNECLASYGLITNTSNKS